MKINNWQNREALKAFVAGCSKDEWRAWLYESAEIAGTDKGSLNHTFAGKTYLDYYAEAFYDLRTQAFNLWELGVYKGQGCLFWKLIFPHATIIGFDHSLEPWLEEYNKPAGYSRSVDVFNTRTMFDKATIGASHDVQRLLEMVEKAKFKGELCLFELPVPSKRMERLIQVPELQPTIVIDDASHIHRWQTSAFIQLFPFVRRGGWWVIEDTNMGWIPPQWGNMQNTHSGLNDEQEWGSTLRNIRRAIDMRQSLALGYRYYHGWLAVERADEQWSPGPLKVEKPNRLFKEHDVVATQQELIVDGRTVHQFAEGTIIGIYPLPNGKHSYTVEFPDTNHPSGHPILADVLSDYLELVWTPAVPNPD